MYICITTYVYMYICHCLVQSDVFNNAHGIQDVDLEEIFRMRWSNEIFVLQVSRYCRFRFGKGAYYIENLQG